MAHKPDFPPLLPPGYHQLTLDLLKLLCADAFEGSERAYLFYHLEQLVQDLLAMKLCCEIWVDGSFLTSKGNPSDIDVIIKFDYDVTANFTQDQKDFVDKLETGEYNTRIDSFVFTALPRDHPEFVLGESERSGWAELFNVEHGQYWLKGVAVIRVGENDVGLRFYP
jgi:hypothetical protein